MSRRLQTAGMSEVDWTRATVTELKEQLKLLGQPVTGKKDDLLERVLTSQGQRNGHVQLADSRHSVYSLNQGSNFVKEIHLSD